jgi:asparagine synthetase B (glutamine-hydrolysing)
MGTEIERVDGRAERSKLLVEAPVNPVHGLFGEQTPADTRLIGDADDKIVVLPKETQRIAGTARQFRCFRIREVVEVRHEGTVPVHKNGAPPRTGSCGLFVHTGGGDRRLLTLHDERRSMTREAISSPTIEEVAHEWQEAISRTIGNSRSVSVLYSGGLDSSLVAVGAHQLSEVELVTVGLRGSPDLLSAELGARRLGLDWTNRVVDQADVERILVEEGNALAKTSDVSRPVLIGLALALEASSNTLVLCGQGADELFLGYAHSERLSAIDAARQRQHDLDRLLKADWPVSIGLAERRQKVLKSPFLDLNFLTSARTLSIDRLRAGGGRKPFLRQVAASLGVPDELANRPKKAFQYGSGIDRLWRSRSWADGSGPLSRG